MMGSGRQPTALPIQTARRRPGAGDIPLAQRPRQSRDPQRPEPVRCTCSRIGSPARAGAPPGPAWWLSSPACRTGQGPSGTHRRSSSWAATSPTRNTSSRTERQPGDPRHRGWQQHPGEVRRREIVGNWRGGISAPPGRPAFKLNCLTDGAQPAFMLLNDASESAVAKWTRSGGTVATRPSGTTVHARLDGTLVRHRSASGRRCPGTPGG